MGASEVQGLVGLWKDWLLLCVRSGAIEGFVQRSDMTPLVAV